MAMGQPLNQRVGGLSPGVPDLRPPHLPVSPMPVEHQHGLDARACGMVDHGRGQLGPHFLVVVGAAAKVGDVVTVHPCACASSP